MLDLAVLKLCANKEIHSGDLFLQALKQGTITIKKLSVLVVLVYTIALPSLGMAWNAKSILGTPSTDTKILAGSLFLHSRDFIDEEYRIKHKGDNFRPALGITHKGWVAYYFETSHHQDSYTLGIERLWYSKQKKTHQMNIGYRAGLLYGYCSRNIWKFQVFEECDSESKYHFFPMWQAFINYTIGPIGLEFATAIMMSNANIVFRFD